MVLRKGDIILIGLDFMINARIHMLFDKKLSTILRAIKMRFKHLNLPEKFHFSKFTQYNTLITQYEWVYNEGR